MAVCGKLSKVTFTKPTVPPKGVVSRVKLQLNMLFHVISIVYNVLQVQGIPKVIFFADGPLQVFGFDEISPRCVLTPKDPPLFILEV